MAEYTKVTSFVDLDKTEAEKIAFIKQIDELIAKIKSVGLLEFKLAGAAGSAETLKVMADLGKSQADLTSKTKDYEKTIADVTEAKKKEAAATQAQTAANATYGKGQRELLELVARNEAISKQLTTQKKQLNDAFKAGAITEAQYITNLGKIKQEQIAISVSSQAANLALKNIEKGIQAADGSTNELRAELNLLLQTLDGLSDEDRVGAVGQELLSRINQVTKVVTEQEQITGRFGRNVGNYANSLADGFDKVRREIARLKQDQEELNNLKDTNPAGFNARGGEDAIKRTSAAIGELEQVQRVSLNTNQSFSRTVKQIEQNFVSMSAAGNVSAEFLKDFKKFAADAKDQAGDLRDEVKALSSDTRTFDMVSGTISAVASGFQLAAGAAALFGGNEEDVQKQTARLVAVMSIANGAREIANELTKKGTLLNIGYTYIQNQVAIAMDRTALASSRLNATLGLLGIAVTVIGAVAIAFAAFSKKADEAASAQKTLSETLAEGSDEYTSAVKLVNELKINIGLAKEGFLNKDRVLKQYNETLGKTVGEAGNLNEAEELLVKNGDAYIQMTLLKAAANLALEEAAQKALAIEKKRLTTDFGELAREGLTKDQIKRFNELGELLTPVTLRISAAGAAAKKADKDLRDSLESQRQAIIDSVTEPRFAQDLKKEQAELLLIGKNFQEKAAIIAKGFKGGFFGDDQETKDTKDKKAPENFKKDLEKQLQEELKIRNDITRARLEGQAKELLAGADNEKNSFATRYQLYRQFYDKSLELIKFNKTAELAELQSKTDEEKRLIQEKLDDPTVKLTAQQRKDLNDTLQAIDDKSKTEAKLITIKNNNEILELNRANEAQITKAIKENSDEQIRLKLEAQEKFRDKLRQDAENQTNTLKAAQFADLAELNRQFRDNEISLTEYNKRRLKLSKDYARQELEIQIKYFEDLLKSVGVTEAERLDIEARLGELRVKKDQEITDKKIANEEKLAAKKKELAEEVVNTFETILLAQYEREKNEVQGLIDKLEEKRLKDIEVAKSTAANAQEAADRVAVINATADAQRKALERRQRQIDEERARFEKVASIARVITDTAAAIIATLKETPAPAGLPLAFAVGAIGAAQLARIIATPVPKYAEGLDEADRDHLAITGDGGRRELVIYPDGSGRITPDRPTLTWIPKGASVIPNIDEGSFVFNQLAAGYGRNISDNGFGAMAATFKKESRLTREAILNKKEANFFIKNGVITMSTRQGYNETEYLNQNINF